MEKVTQTTAATAEESAAASEEAVGAGRDLDERRRTARRAGRRDRGQAAPVRSRSAKKATVAPAVVHRAPAARVVKMTTAMRSPEDEIPLEDTGTYGRF